MSGFCFVMCKCAVPGTLPTAEVSKGLFEKVLRDGDVSQRGDPRGKPGNWKYLSPPYTRMPNINHVFPLHSHRCSLWKLNNSVAHSQGF